MKAGNEPPVRILDIRDHGSDMAFLDELDRSSAHRLGLVDRVVLVDSTCSLLDNHIRILRLVSLSHVRAVICVAVGPIDLGDEIVLRQSAALGSTGVTLWVGDERGSVWAGGTDRPRPITSGPLAMLDLIAALGDKQVFDEVFAAVRKVPYQAVCPGLDVVRPTVTLDELRMVRAGVLEEFVRQAVSKRAWPPAPEAVRQGAPPDPERDLITPESVLGRSRQTLRRVMAGTASDIAAAPGLPAFLLGRSPADLPAAAAAFDIHAGHVQDLLVLLDHEAAGRDVTDQLRVLGVPPPDPSDNAALEHALRRFVRSELSNGRSLQELTTHLRLMSNQCVPEGAAPVRAKLAAAGTLPPEVAAAPPAQVWPIPAIALSLLSGAVTAAATWLTSSVAAGAAVGLVWALLIFLLVLRLPGRAAAGFRLPDLAAVATGLGVAAASGYGGSLLPPAGVPFVGDVIVVTAAVVIALGATLAAWRQIIGQWAQALRIPEARRVCNRIESIVDAVVRDRVRGLHHRRRLSDAALLVASGVSELARLYAGKADRVAGHDQNAHSGVAELPSVLRDDLVSLSMRALDDYLLAIGTGSPLRADPARLVAQADQDFLEYQDFMETHGIHTRPPMIDESNEREALSLAQWQRSDVGQRVLRSDGRDELVQLCQTGDIRALNVAWKDVRVLRFAPAFAQHVMLGGTASVDVIDTDLDMIGVLRLVPLGAGRVVYEQPTYTDHGVLGGEDND